jgi:hypothetical protein
MKIRTKLLGAGAAVVALAVGTYAFAASSEESSHGFGPHAMRHGMARMMGHGPGMMGQGMMGSGSIGRGMMGHGGDQATRQQVGDIHALLSNHDSIRRTVINLPDGIRTVTESDDAELASVLKTHVADMIRRVEAGDNANLPMQTSRLHAIFRNKGKIRTTVETTDKGVIVVQTSNDPQAVAALQAHAADVTKLVRGGMAAMHAAMMEDAGGPNPAGSMMGRAPMGHGMMHGPR